MALQMAEEEKALFLYGRRETVEGIPIPVTVMVMQIVYLQYQYLVPLKVDINLGI